MSRLQVQQRLFFHTVFLDSWFIQFTKLFIEVRFTSLPIINYDVVRHHFVGCTYLLPMTKTADAQSTDLPWDNETTVQ